VAIKLVHAELARDEQYRARFRSEVEQAREVPSYCTAEVLDADLDHEPPYLVVEYVDGPSLADVVDGHGPLAPSHLHSVAVGVATALAGIHGAGVMHRDLKPDNVLLAPGSPKVIDFGIARAFEATGGHTRTNHMVGTIAYMAPERFSSAPGVPPGPAADVFSWGCVVGYAANGRTPFHGDSQMATAGRILTQRPHLGGLAEPLRSLVELALSKNPADRPTARELLDMLVGGRPVPPVPPPAASSPAVTTEPGRPAHVRAYSRPKVAALIAVLLVLTGVATIAAVMRADGPAGEAVAAPPPVAVTPSAAAPAVRSPSATAPPPSRPAATRKPTRRPVPAEPRGGVSIVQHSLRLPGPWLDPACPTLGIMTVTRFSRGSVQCDGPEQEIADDFGVAVTAAVRTPGACAAVWFHWSGDGGHLLRLCRDTVRIGTDGPGGRRTLATLELDQPLRLRQEARLHFVVRAGVVDVWLGGDHLGFTRLPAGGPDSGQVRIGLSSDTATSDPPYSVAFADIDIRDLSRS
jgi:serine/threonine protein kinase